jgi:hypothetical protein
MANLTFSTLSSNGGRISAVLSALVVEKLYDPTDLRSTLTFIPWSSFGSDTMNVTQNAVPGAFSAASSETSGGASEGAYTTSKFSLQVSRYYRKYIMSDLFGITGGPIDVETVVQNLMDGVALTMTDLTTALFPNIASNVGSTGVALDVDKVYDGMYTLNLNNVQGQYTAVLKAKQMNQFRSDLRSEAGPIQWVAASAEMLASKGPGFQGTWNGVDFYQSDSVTDDGTDFSGAMFGQGFAAYTMAPVRALQGQIPASNILVDAGELLVELSRDADNGLSTALANIYPSVVEAEDLRGVEIISGV